MKNLLLFLAFILSGMCLQAQDLILTTQGKLLKVEILEVGTEVTLYRESSESEVLSISNKDVKNFKWETNLNQDELSEIERRDNKISVYDLSENKTKYQDLILTRDGRLLEVEIVSVESVLIFYKQNRSPEIKVINKRDVQAFKYAASKGAAGNNRVFALQDLDGNKYNLVKVKTVSRKFGTASAVFALIGVGMIAGAYSSNSLGPAILLGLGGLSSGGISVICGVISIATNGRQGQYILKKNSALGFDSFSSTNLNMLKKQDARNVYLSASSRGVGLQLNF